MKWRDEQHLRDSCLCHVLPVGNAVQMIVHRTEAVAFVGCSCLEHERSDFRSTESSVPEEMGTSDDSACVWLSSQSNSSSDLYVVQLNLSIGRKFGRSLSNKSGPLLQVPVKWRLKSGALCLTLEDGYARAVLGSFCS